MVQDPQVLTRVVVPIVRGSNREKSSGLMKVKEYDLAGEGLMRFFWGGAFGRSWNTLFYACARCEQIQTGESAPSRRL